MGVKSGLSFIKAICILLLASGCSSPPKSTITNNGVKFEVSGDQVLFPIPAGMKTSQGLTKDLELLAKEHGEEISVKEAKFVAGKISSILVKDGESGRGRKNRGVAIFFNEKDNIVKSFIDSSYADDPIEQTKIVYKHYTGAVLIDYLDHGAVNSAQFDEFKGDLKTVHKDKLLDKQVISKNKEFKGKKYKLNISFDAQEESESGSDYYTYYYIRNGDYLWDGQDYRQDQIVGFTMFRFKGKVYELRVLQNYRSPEDRILVQERTKAYLERLGVK